MSGLVQAADVAALEPPAKPRGFVREVLLGQRVALVGLAILIVFTLIAVAAPWIEPDSTTQQAGAGVRSADREAPARPRRRRHRHAVGGDRRAHGYRCWSGSRPRPWRC